MLHSCVIVPWLVSTYQYVLICNINYGQGTACDQIIKSHTFPISFSEEKTKQLSELKEELENTKDTLNKLKFEVNTHNAIQ